MSLYTNPINQTIPTIGSNRATEEIDATNYTAYWQSYLFNLFSSANRLTGGTGFDGDNIADLAIKTNHINLSSGYQQRITGWTGNNIDLLAGERFVLYTFNVLNPKINSEIDILLRFYLGVYGDKNIQIWLQRSTTPFAQDTGYLLSDPTTGLINIGPFDSIFFALQSGTNTVRQFNMRDIQAKPVGILYYRVVIKAITSIRVYNGDGASTSADYRIY